MISNLIDKLTGDGGLLRVRAGIALALVGGFIYLAIDGLISSEVYVPLTTAAVSYYFGTRGGS